MEIYLNASIEQRTIFTIRRCSPPNGASEIDFKRGERRERKRISFALLTSNANGNESKRSLKPNTHLKCDYILQQTKNI